MWGGSPPSPWQPLSFCSAAAATTPTTRTAPTARRWAPTRPTRRPDGPAERQSAGQPARTRNGPGTRPGAVLTSYGRAWSALRVRSGVGRGLDELLGVVVHGCGNLAKLGL